MSPPLGRFLPLSCWAVLVLLAGSSPARAADRFQVSPAAVRLGGSFARQQLVVTAPDGKGNFSERSADLTGKAAYRSANPEIVAVSPAGQLLAVGNGETAVVV